jgi:hypothetical protein
MSEPARHGGGGNIENLPSLSSCLAGYLLYSRLKNRTCIELLGETRNDVCEDLAGNRALLVGSCEKRAELLPAPVSAYFCQALDEQ